MHLFLWLIEEDVSPLSLPATLVSGAGFILCLPGTMFMSNYHSTRPKV